MPISNIASELIAAKAASEAAEAAYTRKRDEMYNALATQPGGMFEYDGFRFTRTQTTGTVTVTKQSVIEALNAASLPQNVLEAIIGAALIDGERVGGIQIRKL